MVTALVVVAIGCVVAYFVSALRDSSPSTWRLPRGFFTSEGFAPTAREARRMADELREPEEAPPGEGDS